MSWTPRTRFVALAIAVAVLPVTAALPASGDVIHLRNGKAIEGQVIERTGSKVHVEINGKRVTLEAGEILRVEASSLPLQAYLDRKAEAPDTADGQYALAIWCRNNGFDEQAARHFAAVLKQEPDHGPTRSALGHVKVGKIWLEVKGSDKPKPAGDVVIEQNQPAVRERARQTLRKAEAEMVGVVQAEWFRYVRAIQKHYLESVSKRRFAEGADKLLAIRDPLAVEPLGDVLRHGGTDQRKLLVLILSRFRTSPGTLALLERALLDDASDVRKAALIKLFERNDPRIGHYLTRAVASNDEAVMVNAAYALGYLRMVEAIPALVRQLTEKETRLVETERVVSRMRRLFVGPDGRTRSYTITRKRSSPFREDRRKVTYTVYRTHIQESLIAITGKNFGFDAEAWMDWYRRNRKDR